MYAIMTDICNAPFYVRLGGRRRGPDGTPVSSVRGIRFANIVVKDADSRYASIVAGLDSCSVVSDVEFCPSTMLQRSVAVTLFLLGSPTIRSLRHMASSLLRALY